MDTIAGIGMGKRRRFWSDEEKRRIVSQARLAELSVSEVARRYDVNANLVFTWLHDPRFREEAEAPAFLPVMVSAETEPVIETASCSLRQWQTVSSAYRSNGTPLNPCLSQTSNT